MQTLVSRDRAYLLQGFGLGKWHDIPTWPQTLREARALRKKVENEEKHKPNATKWERFRVVVRETETLLIDG